MAHSSAAADGGAEPSRGRSRASRREQLVCRALETLAELGETATIEDLAAGMGVNKATLYRYFGNRAGLHRALVDQWISRAMADDRAAAVSDRPTGLAIEAGFLVYLGALERERTTYLALTQLGHVSGPGAEEHLASLIAATGDAVTEMIYERFPGVRPGSEIGRTWGQAIAGMSHHVADRWARAPWAPKEDVARSLARLVLPALDDKLHDRPDPPSTTRP
jgi:AcrR family transcriptional regulator